MMKTILLVEDDPNDVFFFTRAMGIAGVTTPIQLAADGREAIDYLKGSGKFVDRETFPLPTLVLLDLKLPFVMGLDVLKWIRRESGLQPVVVVLSASSDPDDIASAYELGANGFLVKPSETGKLVEIARSIGNYWLAHNVSLQEFCGESQSARPRPQPERPVTSEARA